MPELPEVETTRRGIAPALQGATITGVWRSGKPLRWAVPDHLPQTLTGAAVTEVGRRGKYLLIRFPKGVLLLHLGMSGSLRLCDPQLAPGPWDHFALAFKAHDRPGSTLLRLTDPRRFGGVVWHPNAQGPVSEHPLLHHLGIEPLEGQFDGAHLRRSWQGRSQTVKQALLGGDAVVGVGNIYASEALHRAGIRPQTRCGRLSRARCEALAEAVKHILSAAIAAGGSTLRDFVGSDGASGHFQTLTQVYDRAGQACHRCAGTVRQIRQGQRSTYYCPGCQH